MTAPAMSNTSTAPLFDHAQLRAAQDSLARLAFPLAVEPEFQREYNQQSILQVIRILPWITALYLGIGVLMLAFPMPGPEIATWRDNALLPVGAVLAFLWITLAPRRLDAWINPILVTALAIALIVVTRCVFLIEGSALARYTSYSVIYLVLITFALSRLRLRYALATTGLALASVVLSAFAENLTPDWLAFSQYFLFSSGFCAVLGYLLEQRERADWLHRQQRALEVHELSMLRARADAGSRRQQRLGDYQQCISGNPTPNEIVSRTLSFLIDNTGAQVGTIFVAQGERLLRAAASGMSGDARLASDLGRGETLIGQAADNRRRMRLFHLPEDYCVIATATGSARPAELLIEPVHREGKTLAVIELGSLQRFSDEVIDLVDHLAPVMAGALIAAIARDALTGVDFDMIDNHQTNAPSTYLI